MLTFLGDAPATVRGPSWGAENNPEAENLLTGLWMLFSRSTEGSGGNRGGACKYWMGCVERNEPYFTWYQRAELENVGRSYSSRLDVRKNFLMTGAMAEENWLHWNGETSISLELLSKGRMTTG